MYTSQRDNYDIQTYESSFFSYWFPKQFAHMKTEWQIIYSEEDISQSVKEEVESKSKVIIQTKDGVNYDLHCLNSDGKYSCQVINKNTLKNIQFLLNQGFKLGSTIVIKGKKQYEAMLSVVDSFNDVSGYLAPYQFPDEFQNEGFDDDYQAIYLENSSISKQDVIFKNAYNLFQERQKKNEGTQSERFWRYFLDWDKQKRFAREFNRYAKRQQVGYRVDIDELGKSIKLVKVNKVENFLRELDATLEKATKWLPFMRPVDFNRDIYRLSYIFSSESIRELRATLLKNKDDSIEDIVKEILTHGKEELAKKYSNNRKKQREYVNELNYFSRLKGVKWRLKFDKSGGISFSDSARIEECNDLNERGDDIDETFNFVASKSSWVPDWYTRFNLPSYHYASRNLVDLICCLPSHLREDAYKLFSAEKSRFSGKDEDEKALKCFMRISISLLNHKNNYLSNSQKGKLCRKFNRTMRKQHSLYRIKYDTDESEYIPVKINEDKKFYQTDKIIKNTLHYCRNHSVRAYFSWKFWMSPKDGADTYLHNLLVRLSFLTVGHSLLPKLEQKYLLKRGYKPDADPRALFIDALWETMKEMEFNNEKDRVAAYAAIQHAFNRYSRHEFGLHKGWRIINLRELSSVNILNELEPQAIKSGYAIVNLDRINNKEIKNALFNHLIGEYAARIRDTKIRWALIFGILCSVMNEAVFSFVSGFTLATVINVVLVLSIGATLPVFPVALALGAFCFILNLLLFLKVTPSVFNGILDPIKLFTDADGHEASKFKKWVIKLMLISALAAGVCFFLLAFASGSLAGFPILIYITGVFTVIIISALFYYFMAQMVNNNVFLQVWNFIIQPFKNMWKVLKDKNLCIALFKWLGSAAVINTVFYFIIAALAPICPPAAIVLGGILFLINVGLARKFAPKAFVKAFLQLLYRTVFVALFLAFAFTAGLAMFAMFRDKAFYVFHGIWKVGVSASNVISIVVDGIAAAINMVFQISGSVDALNLLEGFFLAIGIIVTIPVGTLVLGLIAILESPIRWFCKDDSSSNTPDGSKWWKGIFICQFFSAIGKRSQLCQDWSTNPIRFMENLFSGVMLFFLGLAAVGNGGAVGAGAGMDPKSLQLTQFVLNNKLNINMNQSTEVAALAVGYGSGSTGANYPKSIVRSNMLSAPAAGSKSNEVSENDIESIDDAYNSSKLLLPKVISDVDMDSDNSIESAQEMRKKVLDGAGNIDNLDLPQLAFVPT